MKKKIIELMLKVTITWSAYITGFVFIAHSTNWKVSFGVFLVIFASRLESSNQNSNDK